MPTYQYACKECDHRFEVVQSFSDASLTDCPECEGALRKLYGSVGVIFKGSGFYRTDSRSDSKSGNGSSTSSTGSSDSSGSSGSSSSSGSSDSGSGGGATGSGGAAGSSGNSGGGGNSGKTGSTTSTAAAS
ncbi:FmdB family transcriptional regulator [Saccharomonospora piscinae]|uniref:FmdB family transcriptional regulator n=1 Tax=Saccharomonospora piscinae TaxID=687388 RepID=A0A1V9A6D4_SACPI|nr:FmdB family zinc ribbon protein [Saccharomonospora piscinae]OQO92608.1 FmdB family transcriptional regulator [Saccharomonospora piscinae]